MGSNLKRVSVSDDLLFQNIKHLTRNLLSWRKTAQIILSSNPISTVTIYIVHFKAVHYTWFKYP